MLVGGALRGSSLPVSVKRKIPAVIVSVEKADSLQTSAKAWKPIAEANSFRITNRVALGL